MLRTNVHGTCYPTWSTRTTIIFKTQTKYIVGFQKFDKFVHLALKICDKNVLLITPAEIRCPYFNLC